MNQQIFLILSAETNKGGLFDIGATLPLVAIQFLMLMFILNIILYNPILNILNERNEYILNNLNKAADITLVSTELSSQYEKELFNAKKDAKNKIVGLQKIQKEKFEIELKVIQNEIDRLIEVLFEKKKARKNMLIFQLSMDSTTYVAECIIYKLQNF
jgi:F-type H+-transporting ATPase subunit b